MIMEASENDFMGADMAEQRRHVSALRSSTNDFSDIVTVFLLDFFFHLDFKSQELVCDEPEISRAFGNRAEIGNEVIISRGRNV